MRIVNEPRALAERLSAGGFDGSWMLTTDSPIANARQLPADHVVGSSGGRR
jgi:hypothetical protein